MREATRTTEGKDDRRLLGARARARAARPTLLLHPTHHDRYLEIKGKARREGWQTVAVTFDSGEAAEMRILALAQDARILGPDTLREAVRRKAVVLNTMYG